MRQDVQAGPQSTWAAVVSLRALGLLWEKAAALWTLVPSLRGVGVVRRGP